MSNMKDFKRGSGEARFDTNASFMVINGDTNNVENLQLSRSFRGTNIYVFFYEPLTLTQNGSLYYGDGRIHKIPELEYLTKFNANNNWKFKITAYCCDYNIEKHIGWYKGIQLKTYDLFCLDTVTSWPGPMMTRLEEKTYMPEITHNFNCPNFRHTAYREALVAYMVENDYHENGHISYYHEHDDGLFHNQFPHIETSHNYDAIKRGINKMEPQLPFSLEVENPSICTQADDLLPYTNGTTNIIDTFELMDIYRSSLFSIVTESRFLTPMPSISEKTLKPIMYRRPFIILGGAHSLEYLHRLGFKTFGDFIDESYDEEEDHVKRFDKILELMDTIGKLTYDERFEFFLYTQDVCLHNYEWMMGNLGLDLFDLEGK